MARAATRAVGSIQQISCKAEVMACFLACSAMPERAFADACVSASTVTSAWVVPLISGLLGIVGALAAPFVKDFYIQSKNEKRAKHDTQTEILRLYIAPLSSTCGKLIWRFKEVFLDNRHQFLKKATLPLVYNEYKRHSTLYRIATLLGWMRAIQLELDALPRGAAGLTDPIFSCLSAVRSALADGSKVELHRLEQICTIWRLGPIDDDRKPELAARLEVKLYEIAGDDLKHDSNALRNKSRDEKIKVCADLADLLCKLTRRGGLRRELIDETVERVIDAISYKEALIYREWQDAIGDAVTVLDEDSKRRFKIIGYSEFQDRLSAPTLWMEVFRESIVDIDFESIDANDFRRDQLKDVCVAVSKLLLEISIGPNADLIDMKTKHVAQSLIKNLEPASSS